MSKSSNSKVYNLLAATNKLIHSEPSGNRLFNLIDKSMMIEGKDCLAEEFDVSITTVERWIREGVPREHTKQESLWLFHRGRVARWRREIHGNDSE
jgi:hypothetical protein